jgi:hypothetical protein
MLWRNEILLITLCLAASSGCLCRGMCTKRENEKCCPTDIRKTHYWCFGEDSILHGPCGPKEELYGYERTEWREWPDCHNMIGTQSNQPVEVVNPPKENGRGPSPEELPRKASGAETTPPFQDDPLPTEQPSVSKPSAKMEPAKKSSQFSAAEREMPRPVQATAVTEISGAASAPPVQDNRLPTEPPSDPPPSAKIEPGTQSPQFSTSVSEMPRPIQATAAIEPPTEPSPATQHEWSGDVDLRWSAGAHRSHSAVVQTPESPMASRLPLIESLITREELERRRSYATSPDAFKPSR